jgi:mannose-6-phosphate isomerase-like protein (cupin superfamily)
MRNKMFVSADGATVSIQDGNVPKHLHPNANEMQYILEGTGTIWLGDKEVRVKPGDLVIIPHGGTKPDGRPFKAIAIKTPP